MVSLFCKVPYVTLWIIIHTCTPHTVCVIYIAVRMVLLVLQSNLDNWFGSCKGTESAEIKTSLFQWKVNKPKCSFRNCCVILYVAVCSLERFWLYYSLLPPPLKNKFKKISEPFFFLVGSM